MFLESSVSASDGKARVVLVHFLIVKFVATAELCNAPAAGSVALYKCSTYRCSGELDMT